NAGSEEPLRLMFLGGEPLREDIIMWWNFVGRTHEEIVEFRARYQAEIGVELEFAEAPIADIARRRGGLAADAEQFGPFAPHTPPAPRRPGGESRARGRTGRAARRPPMQTGTAPPSSPGPTSWHPASPCPRVPPPSIPGSPSLRWTRPSGGSSVRPRSGRAA